MGKIDLSYLESVTDNDHEIMIEMIDLIIEQTPTHIENIKSFNRDKLWKKLGAEAHKIKPMLLYVGLAELKETAEKLEEFGKKETNLELIPDSIQKLDSGFKAIIPELVETKQSLS
ncbi:Hpt domain-containing protein [Gracilimonas tropica]|uniref:Hpt domain-containing protein n=1 Tax=Gracilimonas tropica TaxID=454600 RepID=UPI00036C7B95|nr:Hpt domain-containing protein [Gracilimonas tropica]